MAKIALIVGSVRRDRQGIKVAHWMEEKLKNRNHIVFFLYRMDLNLPLLDKMYKEMSNPPEKLRDSGIKLKMRKVTCLLPQNITIGHVR